MTDKERIEKLKKANNSFSMISEIIMKHNNKNEICCQDVEYYAEYIKKIDKQLAELKTENESYKSAEEIYLNRLKNASKDHDEIVDKLQQQLKEKDEEIDRLKEENIAINQVAEYVGKIEENETALEEYNTSQQNRILMFNNQRLLQRLKTNTHQVCEKIRKDIYDSKVPIEYSKTLSISDNNFINGYQYGTMSCLRILEQIEGGNL